MLKAITYKKRKTKKVKGIMVFFFIIFSTYSFTLVFPFLWIFYNSFKTAPEFLMSGNPWALPQKFLISNYFDVFVLSEFNLGVMFFNSATLVLSAFEEGKTYTISFDVTMLNNSIANGQIFFRFGADEKYVIFNAFEKLTVSFTFTASSSTLFRVFNGDNNETRCAALSCIIGPVTITEVA